MFVEQPLAKPVGLLRTFRRPSRKTVKRKYRDYFREDQGQKKGEFQGKKLKVTKGR